MTQYEVMEAAINTYGAEKQTMVAIEEMSELTKELIKNMRGRDNIVEITEEIADVMIMLKQLQMIYHIKPEPIMEFQKLKLDRLEQRMKGGTVNEHI